jgi:hypothetical protein
MDKGNINVCDERDEEKERDDETEHEIVRCKYKIKKGNR